LRSIATPSMKCVPLSLALALAALAAAGVPSTAAPVAVDSVEAPRPETVQIGGLVFGDAYAVFDHHDPAIEGQNGFWLRRGYLTFDFAIAETWSARLRMEVNSPGDFETGGKLEPFVKDAYLAWKRNGHEIYLGISPSPTFDLVEGFWGYRSVEKTPIDLYRLGRSRDFGVAYRGRAADGKLRVHAMLGNGAGEEAETNTGKKGMLSVAFQPSMPVVLELYADYEARPGSTDRTTYHAFVGFKPDKGRLGVEYASQHREVAQGADQTLRVGSVVGVWDCANKLSAVLRIDRSFDGIPDAGEIPYLALAENTEFDLVLIGLDYKIHEAISLIPNVEYVAYRETDGLAAPDDDLIARLTLYFQF
jgi:hypothetical protein